jgi:hypothetical protein
VHLVVAPAHPSLPRKPNLAESPLRGDLQIRGFDIAVRVKQPFNTCPSGRPEHSEFSLLLGILGEKNGGRPKQARPAAFAFVLLSPLRLPFRHSGAWRILRWTQRINGRAHFACVGLLLRRDLDGEEHPVLE